MLRYGFLSSDFHPQFLILGERDDIAALALMLRRFATDPARVEIENQGVDDDGGAARLELSPFSASIGLRQVAGTTEFIWELDGGAAAAFAGLIEEMLAAPEPAGSTILEVTGSPDIPVKISYGEFTEDFLISAF